MVSVSLFLTLGVSAKYQKDRLGTIQGSVRDPAGAVIAKANISVSPCCSAKGASTANTDAYGSFVIEIAEGTYHVCGEARGFPQECVKVSVEANQTSRPTLVLKMSEQPAQLSSIILDDALRHLAGEDATNCGRVRANSSSKVANTCVLRQFRSGHAFFVRYDLPSIDSEVAAGLASNSARASAFLFDSFGMSNETPPKEAKFEFNNRLISVDCPDPIALRVTQFGRITCFSRNKEWIWDNDDY